MKYFVLSLLMFVVGVGLTHVEREPQEYTPLVRVRTSEGLFFTFVQRGVVKRGDCNEAVDAFSDVLRGSCSTCFIESSGCPAVLEGMDRALSRNERVPVYTVNADAFRVSMVGPVNAVKTECEGMALHMRRVGLKTAVCHAPAAGG